MSKAQRERRRERNYKRLVRKANKELFSDGPRWEAGVRRLGRLKQT